MERSKPLITCVLSRLNGVPCFAGTRGHSQGLLGERGGFIDLTFEHEALRLRAQGIDFTRISDSRSSDCCGDHGNGQKWAEAQRQ